MDTIESKIGERKQFLLDDNLEKLQEEFLSKKEKCNSTITKIKPQETIKNQKNINTNFIFQTGEIKKKKGKKKIKDVITLNLPQLEPSSYPNINDNSNQKSLFSLNYDEFNKKYENKININTGLPETFKIKENIEEKKEKEENVKMKNMEVEENNNSKNKDININNIIENKKIEEKFESKEYEEINNENMKKIEQMSKDEILAAQKEIFSSIPSDLIEKFKDNFFSKQIKKSLNKKENNLLNIENKNKEENQKTNNSNINILNNFNSNSLNKKENLKKEKEEIVLFSYEGKIKKENMKTYLLNNPEQKEMIDYRYLTFEQLDLQNKFFSLEEINVLLSSSNSLQISIGVKLISNLLINNYHKTLDIFIEQLDSLLNKLYYLINSTNINVKSESLKCISLIYQAFFYEDYKKYKFNSMLLGSFPSIIVLNFDNLNQNFQKQKKLCIKNILENNNYNIMEYIRLLNNNVIKESNADILSLIFYTIYVSEKIPCQLDKIFEIDFDILSKNQALIKLMIILCKYEDLDKYIKNFEKLVKNKYFLKYMFELRGISKNKYNNKISKGSEVSLSLKNKIYYINYLLLFNSNSKISFNIYSKENDYLLLSKILLLNMYFCLNKDNNPDSEDYLPILSSDNEINFWTDKFRESIQKLEKNEKERNLNYTEIISLYKFISTFLLLWYKVFKYPKLIAYKKINYNLSDILNLFPLFNSILNYTLNTNIFNKNILILDKINNIRNIYQYNTLLEMNLNYIKCFIKNYDKKTNINGLSLYIIKLSELINKGDEYFYEKYIKIIKTLLCKKLENSKIEKINNLFDYKEIEDDLNFYLYSNDELRKSIFYKRAFRLINNNERLNNINLILENNNNDNLFGSKYFPFDNNFIYQIIGNDKAKVSIKKNYLLILTLLYENENIENILKNSFDTITPFEIIIKILTTIKLSEFNVNKKLYDLYEAFIKFNIIEEKLENINMSKTDNNKVMLSNLFELYESNLFVDENKILIDIIPILFIFLHNNKNLANNPKLIEPFKYKKTIESIVYDNFNCIINYNNFYGLEKELKEKIIDYLVKNKSIMFSSFYQTLILSYLKVDNEKRNSSNNLIYDYIERLCKELDVKKEDYKKYRENDGLLVDIIEKSINKNKKLLSELN